MATDIRSEIFRRREQDPPMSYARIASELGITKSRVQRELQKTARETSTRREASNDGLGGGGSNGWGPDFHPAVDRGLPVDPELAERRRALERSRLEVQEIEAQTRKAEAERRLALLKTPATGGDAGGMLGNLAALLVSELGGIRTDIRQAMTRSASPPPAPPERSLTDRLQEFRELGSVLNAYAPQRPPSSRDELEFKTMMERLGMEERRLTRQFEADLEERRERASGQRSRDEAIAKAIEGAAPLLTAAAERWLKEPEASRSAPAQGGATRPVVLEGGAQARGGSSAPDPALLPGEVRVACPRCTTEFAMTPGGLDDRCPGCGLEVALSEGGQAVARGSGSGPGKRPEPPRFAS